MPLTLLAVPQGCQPASLHTSRHRFRRICPALKSKKLPIDTVRRFNVMGNLWALMEKWKAKSISEVAGKLGVSESALGRWLRGEDTFGSPEFLFKIRDIYKESIDWLIDNVPDERHRVPASEAEYERRKYEMRVRAGPPDKSLGKSRRRHPSTVSPSAQTERRTPGAK